jgi:hypothetical protein
MPPPDGWRLVAGLYSPASNKTRAPASGPRGSKMLLGQDEDVGRRDADFSFLKSEVCLFRGFLRGVASD